MRKETRELDFGIVEERTYDTEGKLVEIRKVYPPAMISSTRSFVRRQSGGHSGLGDL